ncbi:MAG TPA: hypothetical protein VGK19_16130 [Capsulimonadaceae bacterium]|jgi:hypothetical protein
MKIKERLELAGSALLGMLEPHDEWLPTSGYEAAHDVGRWWDAVLRVEEAIGFAIPPEIEAAALHNLNRLTDNPLGLLLNRTDIPCTASKAKLNPHNFRETLIALGGLVRRRNSQWARHAGLKLVRSMDRCLRADGSFDFAQMASEAGLPMTSDPSHTEVRQGGWFDGTATSGRSLEALVWFYEATREDIVFDVATRVAEHHLRQSTQADGRARNEIVNPANVGHDHSYLGTMRGLLLYGLLTGQREYVDRIEATYRNGIRGRIVLESGWAPHDLGKLRFPTKYGSSVNDPASTGDAAQIALWLAGRAGCVDLYDDVERYVRARLLPAQITPSDLGANNGVSFTSRQMGAWGINNATHAAKCDTPDVVAAVTHSLCDIYQSAVTSDAAGTHVHLHMDHDMPDVSVRCTRDYRAETIISVWRPTHLAIRIPAWAPTESVQLVVDGVTVPVRWVGGACRVGRDALKPGSLVSLSFALPERRTEEAMPDGGAVYRFAWRGDEITGVSPQDAPLPFYPAL